MNASAFRDVADVLSTVMASQLTRAGCTVFNGVVATPIPLPPPATLEMISGSAALDEVLACLRARRPVFHSEADLQHSFALAVGEVAPEVRCRLEVPVRGSDASEYLDLLCLGPAGRTAIEFKYVTRQWSGTAGKPPEEYALRGHNAPDVARRDFLRDVGRLERFCDREDQNGLALLITNETALWRPRQRRMPTRDEEFRIHHGRELSGTLLWAGGSFPDNTRVLRGAYMLTWRPYTQLEARVASSAASRCLSLRTQRSPSRRTRRNQQTASHVIDGAAMSATRESTVGFSEAGDPLGGDYEGDPVTGLAGPDAEAGGEEGLAGAECPQEDHVVLPDDDLT